VVGDRVVQMDRRSGAIRDEAAVKAKYGVPPALIPDYLALVGDSADGYPGLPGFGAITAARLVNQHGRLETFPDGVLGENREAALLFKRLATLRTDARLFGDVEELRWNGVTAAFESLAARLGDARLDTRAREISSSVVR
jgi:5'-3' exonuclease